MSFSQFTLAGITPLVSSLEKDESRMIWISLDKPLVWCIQAQASKETWPLSRLDNWDLEGGQPHIINWSEQADWYDRQLHWRGWIPEGIIGSPIVLKPVKKLLPYNLAKGALKGSSVLSKNTLDTTYWLNTLQNGLKVFLSDLTACSIHVPGSWPTFSPRA